MEPFETWFQDILELYFLFHLFHYYRHFYFNMQAVEYAKVDEKIEKLYEWPTLKESTV